MIDPNEDIYCKRIMIYIWK